MTDREKAVVMAYTGACMLTGDKFHIFHEYVEKIMERSVFTHEIGFLANTIKEKAKADFITLCAEQEPKWIPVSERLPEEFADVFCSTNAGEVFIATYLGELNDGVDCFDDDNGIMWEGDVIAWMPLPQAYREVKG